MKKMKATAVALIVMLTASVNFAQDNQCAQNPGSDPCGCNAAQCECSNGCTEAFHIAEGLCGILGPVDGCDEAAAIGYGLCEAACAAAWAGCTAGCSS
jgi:hypothetical protein